MTDVLIHGTPLCVITQRNFSQCIATYLLLFNFYHAPFVTTVTHYTRLSSLQTGAYLELEKECGLLTASLREKVAARRRDLALALTDAARRRVRMTAPDLRVSVYSVVYISVPTSRE